MMGTKIRDFAPLRDLSFEELVLKAISVLDRLPVMVVPDGFPGQPIDAGEVTDRHRACLPRGDGTPAENSESPAAWQNGSGFPRRRANVSGERLRQDPLGRVLARKGPRSGIARRGLTFSCVLQDFYYCARQDSNLRPSD